VLLDRSEGPAATLTDIPGVQTYDTTESALMDFDGYNETKRLVDLLTNSPRLQYTSPLSVYMKDNVEFNIGGVELDWYVASLGEL